jgi:hypothetical protein
MNERIKLLAEQATTIEYGADRGFDRVTFDKEKFAELIVKECCQFGNSHNGEAGLWARYFIREIKEHFGVEE